MMSRDWSYASPWRNAVFKSMWNIFQPLFEAAWIARRKPLLDEQDCLSADHSSACLGSLGGPSEPWSSRSYHPCLASGLGPSDR